MDHGGGHDGGGPPPPTPLDSQRGRRRQPRSPEDDGSAAVPKRPASQDSPVRGLVASASSSQGRVSMEQPYPCAVCPARTTGHRYSRHLGGDAEEPSSLPDTTVHCKGTKVLVTKNIVVASNILNGSVANCPCDAVYHKVAGPNEAGALPAFHITDHGDNIHWFGEPWIPTRPGLFPILPKTEWCEKRCCSKCQMPLVTAKAITTHKCQGMTIGPGHPFTKMVLHLGEGPTKKRALSTAGLVSTACSRAESEGAFATTGSLTREDLASVGHGEPSKRRTRFLQSLTSKKLHTRSKWEASIAAEGGYDALWQWLDECVASNDLMAPAASIIAL